MRARDEGAAAVELALCLVLLIALVGLVAPLPYALAQKSRLEQAAARTARWATSVPAGVRPQRTQVHREAERAFVLAGGEPVAGSFTVELSPPLPQAACPTGRRYTVTLTTGVDLGPFGAMLTGARPGAGTVTMTARATSCEE